MGKKLNSLIKLASRGFNTPVFEGIMDQDDVKKHEKQFMAWEKVSLRTDTRFAEKHKFLLPHHPNLTWEAALHIADDILKKDPHLIVIASKGINPSRSLIAGKYNVGMNKEFIEFYIGPGTIRQMENSEVEMHSVSLDYTKSFPIDKVPLEVIPFSQTLQKMRFQAKAFQPPFLLEFSIYPDKLGMKSERIIFWEIINF